MTGPGDADGRREPWRGFPDELAAVVDRLRRLPARRLRSRRAAVVRLVQEWADLDADLEGEPRRRVPELVGDSALADQLAVVGADLARAAAAGDGPAGEAALARARADLRVLRSELDGA